MNILGLSLFEKKQPIEERSDSYAQPSVVKTDLMNGGSNSADKLSVVYGCITLRAQSIAQLPISVWSEENGTYTEMKDHPLYNVLKRPNKWMTTYDLMQMIVTQLDLYGNAYLQKIKNGLGVVVELHPLNPCVVNVELDSDLSPVYTIDGVKFVADDIVHIKDYSQNGIVGVSKIRQFANLFGRYESMDQLGASFSKNAAAPGGIMTYKGTKAEEVEDFKKQWNNNFKGANSGTTVFLPEGKYVYSAFPQSLTAQDQQYIENMKFSAQRIAADIFRVPAHMLNLNSAPTYASVEQSSREFVNLTLNPIIRNIELAFEKSFGLGEEKEVEIDVNGLLRGDSTARINYYKGLAELGVVTPNDIAEMEGLGKSIPTEQGGDSYRVKYDSTMAGASKTGQMAPPVSGSIEA